MTRYSLLIFGALVPLAFAGLSKAQETATPAAAQVQAIKRIPLQRFGVPGTEYETIIGIAEIDPDTNVGRHTHPGPESGYAIEGDFELLINGEPPRLIKAGADIIVPDFVEAQALADYLFPAN